jgi:hypothetical protein
MDALVCRRRKAVEFDGDIRQLSLQIPVSPQVKFKGILDILGILCIPKQDKRTYNLILWRVRIIIFAVEKQNCVLCVIELCICQKCTNIVIFTINRQ